ncbi:MAG: YdcF family protein [Spirochaetes bacterium]|jgi:SanA protein|nr:YdcF family protein [Spirochaetota bacterium]
MRLFRSRFSLLRISITGLIIAIVSVGAINAYIIASGKPVCITVESCEPAYTAIVLGAGIVNNQYLSPVLEDRVKTAVALYQAGKVEKLLMSGANHTKDYNEVAAMKHYAVRWGVSPKDIFLDYAGFSTYESMYRAEYIFGITDAIIVTQQFHINRSVYLAKNFNINATGIVADRRRYQYIRHYQAREVLARVKAWLETKVTRPLPKFLGDKIPITADGRVTHGL